MESTELNKGFIPPSEVEVKMARTMGEYYDLLYKKKTSKGEQLLNSVRIDRLESFILAAPNEVIAQC